MSILAFVGSALVMCVLIITVRQLKPELSILLLMACGVALTLYLINSFIPLINEIRSLAQTGGIDAELMGVIIKSFGICVTVQTASDVCRDAGQTALAGKIEFGGKLALLLVALPLFRRLLELALEIIGK